MTPNMTAAEPTTTEANEADWRPTMFEREFCAVRFQVYESNVTPRNWEWLVLCNETEQCGTASSLEAAKAIANKVGVLLLNRAQLDKELESAMKGR